MMVLLPTTYTKKYHKQWVFEKGLLFLDAERQYKDAKSP